MIYAPGRFQPRSGRARRRQAGMEMTVQGLRALKGAPLSVLLALQIARQPVGTAWLSRTTGYSDKPVTSALELLVELGLVTRNSRYNAWQLANGRAQLPLTYPELDAEAPADDCEENGNRNYSDSPEPVEPEEDDSEAGTGEIPVRTGNIPIPGCSIDSSSRSINPNKNLLLPSRENEPEKIRFEAARKTMAAAGITEPKLDKLARMGHVTAELAEYHIRTCEHLGQAIYRIEKGWKIRGRKSEQGTEGRANSYGVCPRCFSSPCTCEDDI